MHELRLIINLFSDIINLEYYHLGANLRGGYGGTSPPEIFISIKNITSRFLATVRFGTMIPVTTATCKRSFLTL